MIGLLTKLWYWLKASSVLSVPANKHNNNGKQMNFLGTGVAGGGNASGWYPVKDGASANGSAASGYTTYTQTLTAILKTLPGRKATPGKVNATAYVLVKVQ